MMVGETHVFGLKDPMPLKGWPPGKLTIVRIRLRKGCFAIAYVRHPGGIRQYTIKEQGGYWVPGFEQGQNFRPKSCTQQ